MEKIDVHNTPKQYDKAVALIKKTLSKRNAELIVDYLDASSIGKTARRNARVKQVGLRARLKNLYLLKIVAKYFDKPLDKISIKDMENLIKALNNDSILQNSGKKYSEQTKSNLKNTFISFLRYTLGETKEFHEITSWIETRFKRKDISALTEEEVKKMLNKCVTWKQKVLVALLFDSGCRIEEFLNIRLGDVTEVKGVSPYYRIHLRTEFSKTNGRIISLLWKETTEVLKAWLEQVPDKNNLTAPLYDSTYAGTRKLLKKIGLRALNKGVNPHLMRHTSATYYAGKGVDYFQLCKRYGWSIGSQIPRTYIDMSGINEQEIIQKIEKENVEDIREQLTQSLEENKFLKQKVDDWKSNLNNRLSFMEKEFKKKLSNTKVSFPEANRRSSAVDVMR